MAPRSGSARTRPRDPGTRPGRARGRRVIGHEYAGHGVTANAVAPGYMDTELTRHYLADDPDKRQALIELITAGQFGQLAEVVDPELFLCSPRGAERTAQRGREAGAEALLVQGDITSWADTPANGGLGFRRRRRRRCPDQQRRRHGIGSGHVDRGDRGRSTTCPRLTSTGHADGA